MIKVNSTWQPKKGSAGGRAKKATIESGGSPLGKENPARADANRRKTHN